MNGKNCTTCRFGYQAEEYYSHGRMKWCCMLETGGERKRYALGKARYDPRSCIRWKEDERTCHDSYDGREFGCSECGAVAHVLIRDEAGEWQLVTPIRCPSCDAKVVSE